VHRPLQSGLLAAAAGLADLDEWNALLVRLKAHGIKYQINTPDDGSDFQL
jgi:hypothetical protein